jgi:hypothetical protein
MVAATKKAQIAANWLNDTGFDLCQAYLQELRAKGVSQIYLTNFEFIPSEVNRFELCAQLNDDAGDWFFVVEDADILATLKKKLR